ncbi:MAG: hypothetical protein MZV49_13050 [Rhodopseudomonas palustris]|nr:hypothetical protein [Rhodopseudomonas palustris]
MTRLEAIERQMKAAPDEQVSLTDPDARSMATSGKRHRHRRLQRADRRRHQAPPDRDARGHQRGHRPGAAGEDGRAGTRGAGHDGAAPRSPTAATTAASEILKPASEAGITPLVPKPMTSNSQAERPLRQAGLHLPAEARRVPVPGRRARDPPLHRERDERHDDPQVLVIGLSAAARCSAQCTTSELPAHRRAGSTKHVLERMQARLEREPDADDRCADERSSTRSGRSKHWMGATHFLTRTTAEGAHRDELAGSGVQPEASDADPRRAAVDRGDAGVTPLAPLRSRR